ncbi:unnamed protein product [Cylicostephanus goldi]|uniref:Uncharacterized protein n=1 Tax=Cylicostephanus goldi TaxID=71465 RepID=A0A3P6S9B7_CYLGO|nr:unnamed protein product [Cylicostephanus goldi]
MPESSGRKNMKNYFFMLTEMTRLMLLQISTHLSNDFLSSRLLKVKRAQNGTRAAVFISYVRTLIDLGVTINRLTLLDKRKVSPYMMVMCQSKRRSIYMYPEFKRCRELFVCYDIGLIAPIFAHEDDRFTSLRVFEVDESHVLYKRDLLEYLSNAPNLCEMRVVVPATWSRRVSTCTKGCFTNPDFACFSNLNVQQANVYSRLCSVGWELLTSGRPVGRGGRNYL